MTDTTTIDLLRHGEPIGGRRYRGQIDDPLSERGWQEMWGAVSGQRPWQRVISSPLRRCSQFARLLSEEMKIPISYDERLREVGFGVWEGKTGEDLRLSDPNILTRFYHNPVKYRPTGAESLDEFSVRVNNALTEMMSAYAGQHLLIVAHAGVIRAILAHSISAPLASMYRLSIASASISRLQITRERPLSIIFQGKSIL